jgi:hypothetical protein
MAFAYNAIETAVASAVGISPVHQRGPFRARLQHLTRLGLPDIRSGRGKKIEYSREHAIQWLIATMLMDMGLDPSVIVTGIKQHWRSFAAAIADATSLEARSRFPYFLCVHPRLLQAGWTRPPTTRPLAMDILQFRLTQSPLMGPQHELATYVATAAKSGLIILDFTGPLTRLDIALPPPPRS